MQIFVSAPKIERFQIGLKEFNKFLKHPTPAMKKIGEDTKVWIRKNFESEGGMHDRKSLKWKKLKKSTVENKRKNNNRILMEEGNLKNRWQMTYSSRQAKVRSLVPYADYHESGARRKSFYLKPKGKALKWQQNGMTHFSKGHKIRSARIPRRKILPTEKQAFKKIAYPVIRYYITTKLIKNLRKI